MKKYFFLGLLFLIPLTVEATSPVISKISLTNESSLPEEQIRQLLTVHEGDPFDPGSWEQTLSYLKKWGRFEEVRGEKKTTRQGIELHLILKAGSFVSGIDISGSYPFLSSRIRRLIVIRAGDLFDRPLAEAQADRIAEFYEREGFVGTRVVFSHDVHKDHGTVDLKYRIKKGHRYRIGNVTVKGNTVFPHGWFVSKINPLIGFEPTRLRESLEKIRKAYLEAGYLRARVRVTDLGRDDQNRRVHPTIEVSEGDHVTVLFSGNRQISRGTLKKVIPILAEGGISSHEIEESEREILQLYHSRGFQEATVASEKTRRGPRQVVIRFQIQEGAETQVKKIEIDRIDGNREIPDAKIKKRLLTQEESVSRTAPWRPEVASEDVQNLPRILKDFGALDARMGPAPGYRVSFSPSKDKATVSFELSEGPITRLSEVRFEGNQAFSEKKLRRKMKLRAGRPYSEELLATDKEALVHTYADHGYPYVKILHDLREGVLTLTIQEGSLVSIGEILVVGNERTRDSSIQSALRLKKGAPFSYRKVVESETILRRLGAFRTVDIETIGLAEKEPIVHLLVKIEESKSIFTDLETSYNTDDQLTGIATLSHVNLFGTARRGNLKVTGGRDLQRGEVNFSNPFLFGYNLEGILTSLVELEQRPGFDDTDVGGSIALLHELNPRVNLFARYQVVRTFFRNVIDPTEESEQDHTTSKTSLSTSYDSRDSFSDPSHGISSLIGLDISNKIAGAGFNFLHPKGYIAHYGEIGKRFTLLNFVRVEKIAVIGTDVLAKDQRLFLGGDYTIRGFDQDSIGPIGSDGRPAGATLLLVHTMELQARLFAKFKFAAFIDSGSLTDSLNTIGRNSFRHTAGFGFRYVTPVGPLRLDYGFKLDRAPGEDLSRFHLAFGYAF